MASLQNEGVPAGVVQDAEDLLQDEHLEYRGTYARLPHPVMGYCLVPSPPWKMSRTPAELKRSPCLGEHNYSICTQILGMSDEEFVQLDARGVFR